MNSNVLITGGAGFIGFHLAQSLVNGGYRVHLVDNHARGPMDKHLQELLNQQDIIKEFLQKGGLRCEILSSGIIKVGDTIKLL